MALAKRKERTRERRIVRRQISLGGFLERIPAMLRETVVQKGAGDGGHLKPLAASARRFHRVSRG